jgi:hypothetical protein
LLVAQVAHRRQWKDHRSPSLLPCDQWNQRRLLRKSDCPFSLEYTPLFENIWLEKDRVNSRKRQIDERKEKDIPFVPKTPGSRMNANSVPQKQPDGRFGQKVR